MWASIGKWVAQALLIPLFQELALAFREWVRQKIADRKAKKEADARVNTAEKYEQGDSTVTHDDLP